MPLANTTIDIKIRLAGLWIATMFCYVYGDYFELYVPGKLAGMLAGQMVPLGTVTQGMLVGTSIMLAIQALMICVSLLAAAPLNRWLNIAAGIVFSLVVAMVIVQGGWAFYRLLGAVEIVLLLTLAWQAWHWPKALSGAVR